MERHIDWSRIGYQKNVYREEEGDGIDWKDGHNFHFFSINPEFRLGVGQNKRGQL